MGGPNCSSFRAELRALLEVLRVAVPPLKIFVDNKGVVDGVKKGEKWCTASGSTGADLWRKIWWMLNELEGQEVSVVKVKAHTGWWDVLSGRISHIDHVGNAMADQAAKAATDAAEAMAPTVSFRKQLSNALLWLKWALVSTVEWVTDVDADEVQAANSPGMNRRVGALDSARDANEALRHELWSVRGKLVCRRCGGSWEGGGEVEEQLCRMKCGGCAAGRAAAQATGNINYVWTVHAKEKGSLGAEGGKQISAPGPPGWMVDKNRLAETADSASKMRELLRSAGLGQSEFADEEEPLQPTGGVEVGGSVDSVRPWLRTPEWMPGWMAQPFEGGQAGGQVDAERESASGWSRRAGHARATVGRNSLDHVLVIKGAIAYCARCAQFALHRLGKGLKKKCTAPLKKTANATQSRLNRLRMGLHPISGRPLLQE